MSIIFLIEKKEEKKLKFSSDPDPLIIETDPQNEMDPQT